MITRSMPFIVLALLGLPQGAMARARTAAGPLVPADSPDAPVVRNAGPTPNAAPAAPPDLRRVVDRPVVVYVEATRAALDSLRARLPADDFYVVADDLMFYRATAIEYLEKRPAPFVRVEGRRPIVFRVDGQPRRFDFADVELLDFVIVYDGRAEPRIVAPAVIETIDEPHADAPGGGE